MTTTPAGDRLPPGSDGVPLLGETLAFAVGDEEVATAVERAVVHAACRRQTAGDRAEVGYRAGAGVDSQQANGLR